MNRERPEKVWAWLQTHPSLDELCAKYPEEWEIVKRELSSLFERAQPEALKAFIEGASTRQAQLAAALRRGRDGRKPLEAALPQHIRHRMATLALRSYCLSAATGVTRGTIRFNLLNGYLAQKLLFARGLERKPVSMFWFHLIWPLVWQKKRLMPLVESKGIYCFYSRQLVDSLARIVGPRPCLEIAAGDGTLTRFLKGRGLQIVATDDWSWGHAVPYPESVIRLDAGAALRSYAPEVAICSWPPANNQFERDVFKTHSVQLYIVISSRYPFASGNWGDYKSQSAFDCVQDETLSNLVLPPELGAAVYLFRRKPA
jgi:hypothetical protein